jgi:hypothetical protein
MSGRDKESTEKTYVTGFSQKNLRMKLKSFHEKRSYSVTFIDMPLIFVYFLGLLLPIYHGYTVSIPH